MVFLQVSSPPRNIKSDKTTEPSSVRVEPCFAKVKVEREASARKASEKEGNSSLIIYVQEIKETV